MVKHRVGAGGGPICLLFQRLAAHAELTTHLRAVYTWRVGWAARITHGHGEDTMPDRSFLKPRTFVILLGLLLASGAAAAGAGGTLAVLPWAGTDDAGVLRPIEKEAWFLAQSPDLALIALPAHLPLPAALIALEPIAAEGGDYYLYLVEDAARAQFEGAVRVLYRRGHTLVLWSADVPRLTAESRATLRGLTQPMRISLSPKAWPTTGELPPQRTDFHPLVAQIVSDVSQTEYVAKWQPLDDFETRYAYATQNTAAAAWIHSVLASYGLQARYNFFNMSGSRRNVFATKPGLVHPERVVCISGHFDSTSEDNYNHAPGADDNASGTTAVLEAARVLSQYSFENTIKFIAFSAEEQGMVGSGAYVDSIAAAGEQVVACFDIDMIAYRGTDPAPADLVIYTNSASQGMANVVRDACTTFYPTEVGPIVLVDPLEASDYASFWQHGYLACCSIEDEAWGDDFCPWYHTSNDRIERYPQDYPIHCAGALIAAVAQTAVPMQPSTPYLLLDSVAISDDNTGASHGNGNGIVEYGETIEVTLTLRNIGAQTAMGVIGQLQTSDPYANLLVSQASFGSIPSGGTGSNAVPFVFGVSAGVPDAHALSFTVGLNQPPNSAAFGLTAYAPDLRIIAYDVSDVGGGDGDGIPEPGETVTLSITVNNRGSVGVTACSGTLGDGAFCDADPTPRSFGAIAPAGTASAGPFPVTISASCPTLFSTTLPLRLQAQTAYDRTEQLGFNVGDIFTADMESGAAGWSHAIGGSGFTDQWHLETYRNHTYGGTTSWKCGGTGAADYGNLLYAVLESSAFTLPAGSRLTLWHWIESETSQSHPGYCYDGGLAQISIAGGPWQAITPDGGYPYLIRAGSNPGPFPAETPVFGGSQDWRQESFDLTGYSGSARVRFAFGSDGATAGEGWYLDDVQLVLGTSPAGIDAGRTLALRLHPARPNPARGPATLTLDLPRAARVEAAVFDASGRRVRQLFDGVLGAGLHPLVWDGLTENGRRADTGVYWVRARADGRERSERMIVTR
jgi:hypothetical protein